MNKKKLKLYFYYNSRGKSAIKDFYDSLGLKVKSKILVYISVLIREDGNLGLPYCRHIKNKIWELRVDFDKNYYRLFYFIFDGEKIILLHGFNKKTDKTPAKEMNKAEDYYQDYLNNLNDKLYEF